MPIYTFFCSGCRKTYPIRITYVEFDSFVPKCPFCGLKVSERKLSNTPVVYKGKGFYSNDHKPKED